MIIITPIVRWLRTRLGLPPTINEVRSRFGRCGKHFSFDPAGYYSFESIFVGDHVHLGRGATLMASDSRILIGDKVVFGPHVTIIGGDHNISVVGSFMYDVTQKRPEDDRDVIIEEDVWVGTRAIILKGVTIGRGAVVAAGAIVTRNVPPYAVVAGVPARVLKFRFDVATILIHEAQLYPVEKRLAREFLERVQENDVTTRSCQ